MFAMAQENLQNQVRGAGCSITPLLHRWTEVATIYDYQPKIAGIPYPYDGYENIDRNIVPQVGDFHRKIKDAVCTRVTIEPITSDSSTHLTATMTYERPGTHCDLQIDCFQTVEIRNFDAAGDLTAVPYKPTSQIRTEANVPFVTDVRVPVPVRSFSVMQYEIRTPKRAGNGVFQIQGTSDSPQGLISPSTAYWNVDYAWGFEPGQLLYLGVISKTECAPLYRRRYIFLINDRIGWHHFYAVWVDARGLKPQGVKPFKPDEVKYGEGSRIDGTRGAAAFKVLPCGKFIEEFSFFRLPFIANPTNTY